MMPVSIEEILEDIRRKVGMNRIASRRLNEKLNAICKMPGIENFDLSSFMDAKQPKVG